METFPEHVLMNQDNWLPQMDGLKLILSSWSGKGLIKAISALPDHISIENSWSERDVIERASRILIEKLASHPPTSPLLTRLPKKLRDWQEAIPAAIHSERWTSDTIRPGVHWPSTVSRFGWPPKSFNGKSRKRILDERIISPAIWTIRAINKAIILSKLELRNPEIYALEQLKALTALLNDDTLEAFLIESNKNPTREELNALRNEGKPWSDLAAIASELIKIESAPELLAQELLWPDDELAWRLFHLSVMGLALLGVSDAGYSIKSLRPIGDWGTGPAFRAEKEESVLDIWYEAGGLWKHLNVAPPYTEFSTAISSTPRALGADIAIFSPQGKMLLLECKLYKTDKESAARDGYLQAATYSAEAKKICSTVTSVAVLPSWQVKQPGWTTLPSGKIGLIADIHTREICKDFADEN